MCKIQMLVVSIDSLTHGACSVKHGLGREESVSFYSAGIFEIFGPVFFQLRQRDRHFN